MAIDTDRLVQIAHELKSLDERRQKLLAELQRIAGGTSGGVPASPRRGRPPGSRTKASAQGTAPVVRRGPGRPPGSRNQAKPAVTPAKPTPAPTRKRRKGLTTNVVEFLKPAAAPTPPADTVGQLWAPGHEEPERIGQHHVDAARQGGPREEGQGARVPRGVSGARVPRASPGRSTETAHEDPHLVALERHLRQKGHLVVSHIGDAALRKWANRQRELWQCGRIDYALERALHAIGFPFEVEDCEWEHAFAHLASARRVLGHLPAPASREGRWLQRQRELPEAGAVPEPRGLATSGGGASTSQITPSRPTRRRPQHRLDWLLPWQPTAESI